MDAQENMVSFEGDPPAAAEPQALPDRRELALVAVERTRMPMVFSDAQRRDNPIVLANQAFLNLTGYSADEVIGRNCRFLQGPETDPKDVDAVRAGLAANGPVDVELLNYRKDGSSFWNQLAISPVFGPDGALLYHFASQKDITARRRAEDLEVAERLLLKEVDHRAMNVLALVQSIVRLTENDGGRAYCNSVVRRVDALARAHRLLGANAWSGADLASIVAMESATVGGARVNARGVPTKISAKMVQPVTLILHEMFANAVEHGSLKRPGGSLTIRWEPTPRGTALHWREQAEGAPTEEPASGFGLQLVRGVIGRQLGGTLAMHWNPGGLEAELIIPGEAAGGTT